MFKKALVIILAITTIVFITGCNSNTYNDGSAYEDYDLVVAFYGNEKHSLKTVGDEFAEDNGISIKYIFFESEDEIRNLDIMLMANDTKIDVYCTTTLDVAKYIRLGYYTDLGQYDNLKALIESNSVVKYVSDFDGEYIGIPAFPRYDNKQRYLYMSPMLLTYYFENIDGFTGEYLDPNGEKLFEVFKYLYANDGDIVEYPLEEVDFICVTCEEYMIMSPFSEHKDLAAKYLECMFEFYKTARPYPYPSLDDVSFENAYLDWRSMHYYVREPITLACRDELLATDGSDEALRKLAKEAAREVRQRLEG